MAEAKGFLERWSKRKRAARDAGMPSERAPATEPTAVPIEAAAAEPEDASEPEIDPASLPPIESIETGDDLQAFLRKGVPKALKRAALRRLWSADATIRDFREVADYDWDFNAPGYGALLPKDDPKAAADKLIALMRRRVAAPAEPPRAPAAEPAVAEPEVAPPPTSAAAEREVAATAERPGAANPDLPRPSEAPALAPQPPAEATPKRRRHGGAAPN